MSRADELYKKLQENNRGASVKNAASLSYDAAGAQSGGSRASQLYDAMMQKEDEARNAQYALYQKYQAYQNYLASNPAAARAREKRAQDIYVGSLGSKEKQDAARYYYKYADTYGKLSPEKQAAEAARLNRSDWDVASYGDDVSKYADTDYGRYLWLMTYGDKDALKDYQSEFETTAARSLAMSKAKTVQEKNAIRLYYLYGGEYGKMTPEQQAAEARRLYAENGGTQEWDEAASAAKMGNYNASDAYSRYWWLINYGDKDAMKRERDLYNTGVQNKIAKTQYEENKKRLARIDAEINNPERYGTTYEEQLAYQNGQVDLSGTPVESLVDKILGWFGIETNNGTTTPGLSDDTTAALYDERAAVESDINRYERLEAVNATTYDYMSRPDFEEKSQPGTPGTEDYIQNPSEASDEATSNRIGSMQSGGAIPIGSIVDIKNSGADVWGGMTEDERKVWYYIYRTEGAAKAKEYLKQVTDLAQYRTKEKIQKDIDNASPWVQYVASLASIPLGLADKLSGAGADVIGALTGEYHPYSPAHGLSGDIRAGVSSGMNETEKFFYNAGMSTAESAVGAATFGTNYAYLMGAGAASERARELWEQGANSGQIVILSGLDGIAEALFEHVSLEKLIKPRQFGGKNGLEKVLYWIKEVAKQGFVEGSEEVATGFANIINDIAVRGTESDTYKLYEHYLEEHNGDEELALEHTLWDKAKELVGEGLAGSFSGVLLGAGAASYSDIMANADKAESKIANEADAQAFIAEQEAARAEALMDGKLSAEADAHVAEAEARVKEKYGLDGVTVTEAGKIIESDAFGEAAKNRVVRKMKEAMESAASKDYLTTDSGVTEYAHNGKVDEGVVVTRIIDRDGERMYELGSGDVVSADSVTFGTKAEATVYGMLNDYKVDGESATQIAKDVLAEVGDNAETVKTAEAAMNAINAYNYGELGLDYASAVKTSKENALSSSVMNAAYDLGRAQYEARAAERQAAVDRGELTYRRKGEGKVVYEDSVTDEVLADMAEKKIDKTDISALDRLASALGINIHLYATQIGEDGKRSATVNGKTYTSNGFYDHATGDIYIDVYSGSKGNSLIMFTLAHELTHFIAQNSPAQYKAMADFLVKTYGKKGGEDIDYQIQRQIEKARGEGREIDREEALEEVVADSMEAMFADGEVIKKLASENPSLAKRILAKIKEWLDALVGKYETLDPDSEEGQKLKGWVDEFRQMQDMFVEALKGAKQGYAKAGVETGTQQAVEKVGAEYDAKSNTVYASKESRRSWGESDYVLEREVAAREMSKRLKITIEQAKKYIDDVNSVAKMIADDRERLDYESADGTTLVPNAEYGGSIDFNTICPKRLLYTGTIEAIQNALPDHNLTVDELLRIREVMKDRGYTVACGLCYVEASRVRLGYYAAKFINTLKNENADYIPKPKDINTIGGLEVLSKEHPDTYAAYLKYMNSLAQRKPKLFQRSTEYQVKDGKGEVLRKFTDRNGKVDVESVKAKNEFGGLRLQSFSDFMIIHLIDSMQVIMDMSRVGLAGQAYTKVADFVRALGNTGLKINMSLIAQGVDENGHLVFDEVNGMKRSEAEELRNKYSKNVGTIVVVFTDEQFKAAMADPFVDFIIPFHRSQWNKKQYAALGLPKGTKDFTSKQNERYDKPVYNKNGKKMRPENFMPNAYWNFNKDGKWNAENYLRLCAKDNRIPKFHHLLVNNGDGSFSLQPDGSTDGYWKSLIDFKMYDNDGVGSKQMPVRPDFNMQEAERMLKEYEGGHQSFPVAQDVVDEFVASVSEGKSFSARETSPAAKDSEQTAKDIRRRFGLRMSGADIAEQIGALYEQIAAETAKESPDMDALDEAVRKVAAAIDEVRGDKGQRDDFAQAALDAVRGTKIFLDEKQVAEIKYKYGSLKAFTQKFFGDKITFTSDKSAGVSLDSVWQEWAGQYPAYFDAETSSNDMPSALLDAFDSMKNTTDESAAVDYKSLDAEIESAIWDGYEAFTAMRNSNRAILSNALESAAQTPEEKTNLARYRETIGEINAAEARVKEISAEIKELSFAKGERDTARIAELQKEKAALEKKITAADSRLLKLEASTPLKDLVRRTKEKTRKAVTAEIFAEENKLRAERNAAVEALRKDDRFKNADTDPAVAKNLQREIDKVMRTYRERIADVRTGGARAAETRQKISRLASRLRQMVLRPAEDRYIPQDMLRSVLDLLTMLDRWTPRTTKSGELAAKQNKTAREAAEKILAQYQKIAADLEIETTVHTSQDTAAQDKADEEERAKRRQENAENSQSMELVKQLVEIFGDNKSVRDLTFDELQTVYKVARMIEYQVNAQNKLLSTEKKITLSRLRKLLVTEIRSGQGLSLYNLLRLRPKTVFEAFGNFTKDSAWSQLYEMLNDGQMKTADIMMNLNQIFEHLLPGDRGILEKDGETKHIVKQKTLDEFLSPDNAVDIGLVDEDGKAYTVTHDMLVMLALALDHPYNRAYIAENGLMAPNKKRYYKGDVGDSYSSGSAQILPPGDAERNMLEDERRDLIAERKSGVDEARREEIRDRLKEIDDELTAIRDRQYKWADDLRKAITDNMTDYDRQWYDAWRAFAKESQEYINEATQLMYGFDKATVDNYFPVRTDQRFGHMTFENLVHDFTIENKGFVKPREGKGAQPVYLEGVSYVARDHIRNVAQYAGMAPVLRDVNMLFKYQASIGDGKKASLMRELGKKYDKKGEKWFENLISDLNGVRRGSVTDKLGKFGDLFGKLRGKYAGAVLTLNPSVTLGQFASAPMVAAVLGEKATLKAYSLHFLPGMGAASADLIAKWTPILYDRNLGVSEREASSVVGAQSRLDLIQQKVGFIFNWISMMDMYTVNRVWWAAEYYVRDHSPKLYDANAKTQSDEYYKEVARMFVKAIQETQPNYTTLQRPEILRKGNELIRSLTMFMTQRLQNASVIYEARRKYIRYRYDYRNGKNNVQKEDVAEARAEFGRSVLSVAMSSAALVSFKLIAGALKYGLDRWRDEDKELHTDTVMIHLADQLLESLISNYLGGAEAYDLLKGRLIKSGAIPEEWGFKESAYNNDMLEVSSVERINKAVNDFTKAVDAITKTIQIAIDKDEQITKDDMKELGLKFQAAAATFLETTLGIPARNAGQIAEGLWKHATDIKEGTFWEFEQGVERTKKIQARRVFKAFLAGDEEKVAKVETEVGDQKKLNSAMMDYLNDEYKEGNITREQVTTILSDYLGKSDDDVHWWFEKHDADLPEGESWKKYTEFIDAVDSGKGLEETAKEYLDNGVKKQQLGGAITDRYKDEYVSYEKSGNKKAMEALKKKMLDGYEAAGYDRDDAEDNIDEWYRQVTLEEYKAGKISRAEAESVYRDRYGLSDDEIYWKFQEIDAGIAEEDYGKYDDFDAAVRTGKDLKKVIKQYTDNGVTTKTLASQITKDFKQEYKDASNSERAKLKGYLLNAYVALGYDREKKSKDIDKWLDDAE